MVGKMRNYIAAQFTGGGRDSKLAAGGPAATPDGNHLPTKWEKIKDLSHFIILLQIGDAAITLVAVHYGIGREGNPLIAGIPGLIAAKAIGIVLLIVLVQRLARAPRYWRIASWCLWGLFVFYSAVVMWNALWLVILWS